MRGDVREVYRLALTLSADSFDCPLDFSIHLFSGIGNAYEWTEDGRLESIRTPAELRAWAARPKSQARDDNTLASYNIPRRITQALKEEASKLKHAFMLENIERILDSGPTTSHFTQDYTRDSYYLTEGICWEHTKCIAFDYPENIQPQWAETLLEFVDWWIMCLRYTYRVGKEGEIGSWWPEHILKAYEALCGLSKRLNEKVYGPPNPEKERAVKEMIDRIAGKVLAENKAELEAERNMTKK